jgi:hypothetical protein
MKIEQFAWLIGKTDESDDRLLQRATSYSFPPKMTVDGGNYQGWRADRRAFAIDVEQRKLEIRIAPENVIVNPVFELNDAPTPNLTVVINGKQLSADKFQWDGKTLWLNVNIRDSTQLDLIF